MPGGWRQNVQADYSRQVFLRKVSLLLRENAHVIGFRQPGLNSRECLALEVDTSFPSRRLTRILDNLIALKTARPKNEDEGKRARFHHRLHFSGTTDQL